MIINGKALLEAAPIKDMSPTKNSEHGVSWGLSEIGYDIRVKQEINFYPPDPIQAAKWAGLSGTKYHDRFLKAWHGCTEVITHHPDGIISMKESLGRTALASSVEEFQIPNNLWCEFRNKSTRARQFIDATIGTDGEPGWNGFLTIELIFHGKNIVNIPAGSAILKAVFHEIKEPAAYTGKYQDQEDKPIQAILVNFEG